MAEVEIREAALADAEAVARLVSELGYPTSTGQMHRRLERILGDEDYHTLVARRDGQIVGFVGARTGAIYESDEHYCQIMALAVAPHQRRCGIGRLLMQAAETRVGERGPCVFVVTSGNHRSDAHAFYEMCGYHFTGRRYKKPADPSAATQPGGIEAM